MHLPDGFLDTRTSLLCTGAAAAGVGLAVRQARRTLGPRQMPMLGLAAAFVFAAQLVNFPVAGGTSGHLLGGVLTSVLLGPSAAVLVMTCVLIVQCLVFADGGFLALGANVFNMAIVNVGPGYLIFRVVKKLARMEERRATVLAAAFASWCGTVIASVTCAGELAFSGAAPWAVTFPAMANVHMIIGVGEGLATGLITLAVLRARPQLVSGASVERGALGLAAVGYGLLVSLGLAIFVAPFACGWPDGLERVARVLGFENKAAASMMPAPISDYRVPFIGSPLTATALAGVMGTVLAFAAAYTLARVLVPALEPRQKNARSSH
jgi:cobalt/nickel transport system permease protein